MDQFSWCSYKQLLGMNMGIPHSYFKISVPILQTNNGRTLTKISVQVPFQWNDLKVMIFLPWKPSQKLAPHFKLF